MFPKKKNYHSAVLQGRILLFGLLLLVGSFSWFPKLSEDYISYNAREPLVYSEPSRAIEPSHVRRCISPEINTSWPLGNCNVTLYHDTFPNLERFVVGQSRTSSVTCGFCQQNDFTRYLARLSNITQSYLANKCSMIIYSVKFGKTVKPLHKRFNLTVSQNVSGVNECFIVFIVADDRFDSSKFYPVVPGSENYLLASKTGRWALYVPVPRNVLPYKSNRRNGKLIKMHLFQIFSWTDHVLWMDDKFRQELTFDKFETYYQETVTDKGVCAVFMGLPNDKSTMGPNHEHFTRPTFRGKCQKVIADSVRRPDICDSVEVFEQQCENYLQKASELEKAVPETGSRSDSILWQTSFTLFDRVLIDSALIAWNSKEQRCRKFIADFSCTWADEVQCYSDRDEVSFSYTLFSMGLKVHSGDGIHSPVILKDKNNLSMVEIVQRTCHWDVMRVALPTFDCVHNATISAS